MNLQILSDSIELVQNNEKQNNPNPNVQEKNIDTQGRLPNHQTVKSPERLQHDVDDDRWVVVCGDTFSGMLATLGRIPLDKVKPNITRLYRYYTPEENQKFMVDILREACDKFNIQWPNSASCNKKGLIRKMVGFFHSKFEERFKPNFLLGNMVSYDVSAFVFLFEILFPLKAGTNIRIETELSALFEGEKLPYKLIASTSGRRTAPRPLYSIQYADDALNEISIYCKRIDKTFEDIPVDARLTWRPNGLDFDDFDVDTYFPIDFIMKKHEMLRSKLLAQKFQRIEVKDDVKSTLPKPTPVSPPRAQKMLLPPKIPIRVVSSKIVKMNELDGGSIFQFPTLGGRMTRIGGSTPTIPPNIPPNVIATALERLRTPNPIQSTDYPHGRIQKQHKVN